MSRYYLIQIAADVATNRIIDRDVIVIRARGRLV